MSYICSFVYQVSTEEIISSDPTPDFGIILLNILAKGKMFYMAGEGVPATEVVLELLDPVTNHLLTNNKQVYIDWGCGIVTP